MMGNGQEVKGKDNIHGASAANGFIPILKSDGYLVIQWRFFRIWPAYAAQTLPTVDSWTVDEPYV